MPTPQREPLRRLSLAERAALQRIANSTSERVDQVRRATALLAVARTGVFISAAREAGLHHPCLQLILQTSNADLASEWLGEVPGLEGVVAKRADGATG